MFERETKFITDFTLNSVRKLGSFFTLNDLAAAKIHPAILQYVAAEMDYLIYLDRQRLLQKSKFDYSGAETFRLFAEIAAEIKKNQLLPFEEIRRIVQQAVNFNVNLLLRPRWTLRKFIFDIDEYRSVEELRYLLNYIYYYDYYGDFIIRYIEKNSITSFSIDQFTKKINDFTKGLLNFKFEEMISGSLSDISEFINLGEVLKDRMTIEMMELYLRDRKLDYLITVLRERLSDDLKQKFAIEEFKQIILTTSPDQFAIDFEPFPESEEQLRIPEVKEEKKPALKIIEEEPAENSNLPHFDVEKLFLEIEQEKLVFPTLPDHSKKKEEAPAEAEQPDLELSAPAPEPVSNEISDSLDDGEIEEDLEAIGRHTETIDDTQSFIEPEEAPETLPPQESILQEIRAAMNSNPDADQTEIDQDEILAGAEAEEQTIEPITELEAEIEPEVEHKETPASTEENALIIEEIKAAIEEPAQAPAAPKEEAGEELLNFFTTKETMKIVGSIFNNDSIDFVNTIEKISACGELDEAMSILKSVYFAYSVNAFDNKEVHLLEDRIQKYFTR